MTDEDNSSKQPPPPQAPTTAMARDETWKEQIRRAIEESQRNIEQQQAAQQAPGYRITLNVPRETQSYYDQVRADNPYGIKREKSESEIHKRKRPHTFESRSRRGPNVTSTGGTGAASRYSNWAKHSAKIGAKSKSKKKKRSAGGESSSVGETTEERDITEGGEDGGVGGVGGGTTDTDRAGSSRGKKDDVRDQVLSYFDPNFVKEEFKEIMAKSRNIVVGPPREILQKYFGYTEEDQIPEELREDNSPKAFILPRRYWKDYEDAPTRTTSGTKIQGGPDTLITKKQEQGFIPDRRLLTKLGEEPPVEPYVPRQPKHFAVDYLARQPFKKYGLISSNLNDASPGMMEHLELKEVNVDPGGHLRRDEQAEKNFKISDVTDTPVKVAPKEGPLTDDKRPWYSDGWAEGADPNVLKKSPAFTEGGQDIAPPSNRGRGKPGRKGKGKRESDEDDRRDSSGRHRRRKPRGSSLSEGGSHMGSSSSGSSSGSGYSCTCGYSSSSSGSGSSSTSGSGEGDEGEDSSRKRSKSRRRKKGKSKRYPGEEDGEGGAGEEPSTKEIAIAANINDQEVPPWAPSSWKPPPGYKGWIYKPKAVTHSAPNTSVALDEQPNSRLPGSDWFRAFGVVKKAEKEGTIENLRNILGYIEGEDDLKKLDLPDDEGMSDTGGEEWDVMQRLPRLGDLPSRKMYPEHPRPDHFKYYRSYPLYPSLSTERYFEWYKDVDRLMNPFGRRRFHRPAGYSRSMGHINWNDPKEAAKWYAMGYRRPDTKPKPERQDYDTKDYIYNNARSIMLMPPRRVIPKYIDDRYGTSHLLEPSGLVRKFIFREDFGRVPEYLLGRNEEQCRPRYPDMDKFYRPHRCKYLHGHIHCKICMRAHPTVKTYNRAWECDMTPQDYERASEYRAGSHFMGSSSPSAVQFVYSRSKKGAKATNNFDVECLLNDLGLGEEYRRSKAARGGSQNLNSVTGSSVQVNLSRTSPVYV